MKLTDKQKRLLLLMKKGYRLLETWNDKEQKYDYSLSSTALTLENGLPQLLGKEANVHAQTVGSLLVKKLIEEDSSSMFLTTKGYEVAND